MMKLKSESTVIDGIELMTTQLPGLDSFELLARLGKLFAPAIGALAPLLGGEGGMDKLLSSDVSTLGPALTLMFAQLGGGEAQSLARAIFVSTTARDGGKLIPLNTEGNINLVFSGSVKTLISAMAFVVKVNYADFFDAASSAQTKLADADASM